MEPDLVSKYARRFGGKFGALNQLDYIKKYALDSQSGVCYALCLSYIALHAKGIDFGSVRKQKPIWMFVDGLQRVYCNSRDFRTLFPRLVPEWARVTASLAGLRVLGCDQGVGAPYVEISNALRAHQGGRYCHLAGMLARCSRNRMVGCAFLNPIMVRLRSLGGITLSRS